MSYNTKIEWCTSSWNPIRPLINGILKGYFCTKISDGCANCYSEKMNKRFGNGLLYDETPVEFGIDHDVLSQPDHWKWPRRIFVQSMNDLFHRRIPDDLIEAVLSVIEKNSRHTFIVLTKRPDNMHCVLKNRNLPGNMWVGVTAENQKTANVRIPWLLKINPAVRFLSVEPCLGEVCSNFLSAPSWEIAQLDWVICGGESGPGARPMNPAWPRILQLECKGYGVPFFFKQWGEWIPSNQLESLYGKFPGSYFHAKKHLWDKEIFSVRLGKKFTGRLLDGKLYDEYPKTK